MNLVVTGGCAEAWVMLGKPSSMVVSIACCTRASSQGVEWGQNPNCALSGRRLHWPGER